MRRPLQSPTALRLARRFVTLTTSAMLALPSLAGGCVLPIGPEFQPEPNYPPYISATTPANGVATEMLTFHVRVGDPNPKDNLYYRWIFDYPPFDQAISRATSSFTLPPSADGSLERRDIMFTVTCFDPVLSPALTTHRLLLVVSDRPFVDSTSAQDQLALSLVQPGAGKAEASWTILNLECKSR